MGKSKKTLALVMALVMAFTIVPFGAWYGFKAAAESPDQQAAQYYVPATELKLGQSYLITCKGDKGDGLQHVMVSPDEYIVADDYYNATQAWDWAGPTVKMDAETEQRCLWKYEIVKGTNDNNYYGALTTEIDGVKYFLDLKRDSNPDMVGIFNRIHNNLEITNVGGAQGNEYTVFRNTNGGRYIGCSHGGESQNTFVDSTTRDTVLFYEIAEDSPETIELPITIRDLKYNGFLINPYTGGAYNDALGFITDGELTLAGSENGRVYADFLKLCGDVKENSRPGLTQTQLKTGNKIEYNPFTVIYLAHLLRESMFFGGDRYPGGENYNDFNWDRLDRGGAYGPETEIPLRNAKTTLADALVNKFSMRSTNHYGNLKTDKGWGWRYYLKRESDGSPIEEYLFIDCIQSFYNKLKNNDSAKKAVYDFLVNCGQYEYNSDAGNAALNNLASIYALDENDKALMKDYWYTVDHADDMKYEYILNGHPFFDANTATKFTVHWYRTKAFNTDWYSTDVTETGSTMHTYSDSENEYEYGPDISGDLPAVEHGAGFMDIAYYMLNHFFDDSADYSKTVEEAATALQLKKIINADGSIYYVYDSKFKSDANNWGHNGGVIENNSLTLKDYNSSEDINFNPINGLGYGNEGDSRGNYCYTLHGQGKFVYNPDEKLYFDFIGDDDVMLYINGRLVNDVDLGGLHTSAKGSVKLNNLGPEYGLEKGEIADFDFFYMERCPIGANMRIETNIKLMSANLSAEKDAYTDPDCSPEHWIPRAAGVVDGTTVYYNFGATNSGAQGLLASAPVENLKFEDDNLGIILSKDEVKLGVNVPTDIHYYMDEYRDGEWVNIVSDTYFKNEQEIKNVMAEGITAGRRIYINGFAHTINSATDRIDNGVYFNNLVVTGDVTTGATSKRSLTGYDDASVQVLNTVAEKTFVVDYAGTLNYAPEKVFTADEIAADKGYTVTRKFTKTGDSEVGKATLNSDGSLKYEMNKLMSAVDEYEVAETFTYKNAMPDGSDYSCAAKKTIKFVPANNIYYDSNFEGIAYDENWKTATQAVGGILGVSAGDEIYGNAGSEVNFANRTIHYIEGKGDDVKNVKASFTFTGKGVTLYMDTTANSGNIFVKTTKVDADDNAIGKPVVDMTNITSQNDLKEVPVVNHQNLGEYGKYKVEITVYIPEGKIASLNAIRVYNPLGDDGDAFYIDSEKNAQFIELRDQLIGAGDLGNVTVDGSVFLDNGSDANSIADYKAEGPKNEVYLKGGNAIVFNLNNSKDSTLQVSARSADGKPVTLKVNNADVATINSTVDMYYTIAPDANGNVMISLDGDGILALTNVKVSGATAQQAKLMVSRSVVETVVAYTQAPVEPEAPEEPETPSKPQSPILKFFNDVKNFFNKLFGKH